MKNFVGAKAGMPGVKEGKLQRINDASHRVNQSAGQKPEEAGERKRADELSEYEHADPAHRNIDHRRKPFRAANPERF